MGQCFEKIGRGNFFINPLSANHENSSFYHVLLADLITVIGNKMAV